METIPEAWERLHDPPRNDIWDGIVAAVQEDPGVPMISCSIYIKHFERCLCDLGASVNIMPKVIYEALEYPALSPTTMLVQLADSTIRYPEGIAEHVFVRVRDYFVLADFVVMDMEGDLGVDLVLGRPFLRSAKARIDVRKGEIRFRVGREDMFFRFKKREEQRFMIQQDSEGQALWGAPEPQPEQRPSAPKRKKKEKKVWRKVESSASSSSPG